MALTAEELELLSQLRAKYPEEAARLEQEMSGQIQQSPELRPEGEKLKAELTDKYLTDPKQNVLQKAAGYIGKGIDYAGGNVRASLANSLSEKDIVPSDEWRNALTLRGTFPSSAQILERLGVGPMGQASDVFAPMIRPDSAFDVSGRSAIGAIGDIATDPSNWAGLGLAKVISKGIQGAGKRVGKEVTKEAAEKAAHALIRPIGTSIEFGGRKLYNRAMVPLDQAAFYRGKGRNAVSDILWDENIKGNRRAIEGKMNKLLGRYDNEADALMNEAHAYGARVDPARAARQARGKVNAWAAGNDPIRRQAAETADRMLKEYELLAPRPSQTQIKEIPTNFFDQHGNALTREVEELIPGVAPTGIQEAAQMKTNLYNQVNPTYKEFMLTRPGQEIQKDLARGLKNEIQDVVHATTQKGPELKEINRKRGVLLSTMPKAEHVAQVAERKAPFTQVDAAALALNPKAYVAKNAAKVVNSPWFLTNAGAAAGSLGRSSLLLPALERAYIDAIEKKQREVNQWRYLLGQ